MRVFISLLTYERYKKQIDGKTVIKKDMKSSSEEMAEYFANPTEEIWYWQTDGWSM